MAGSAPALHHESAPASSSPVSPISPPRRLPILGVPTGPAPRFSVRRPQAPAPPHQLSLPAILPIPENCAPVVLFGGRSSFFHRRRPTPVSERCARQFRLRTLGGRWCNHADSGVQTDFQRWSEGDEIVASVTARPAGPDLPYRPCPRSRVVKESGEPADTPETAVEADFSSCDLPTFQGNRR